MKKLLLSVALSVSAMSFAQIDFSSTRYGIVGGANYSRVSNAHNSSGPRYTGQIGASALIPVGKDNQIYLQPEVLFYGAGERGDRKYEDSKGYPHALYGNSYISVPIFLKGYFSEAESEFFGMAGPRFNFLVGQTVKNPAPGRDWYTKEGVDIPGVGNVNGKANSFNFAIALGVGYSYRRKLEAAIQYDLGISNTYKGLINEPIANVDVKKKKSEQVFALTLNYIFD